MKSVGVIGGGLGGLSTAFYLTQRGLKDITLYEATSRVGGWIKTDKSQYGTRIEQGPRTIRPHPNTFQLIEALGIEDKVTPITRLHPAARNRLVLNNGTLLTLPNSLLSLFSVGKPFKTPLIASILKEFFIRKRQEIEDESVDEFIKRRFGSEISDVLISAMIRGICAGDSKLISANSFILKELWKMEAEHGSIVKGVIKQAFKSESKGPLCDLALKAKNEKWAIFSLENGLETLTKALRSNIEQNGVRIKQDLKIESIKKVKNEFVLNEDSKHEKLFMATPAFETGKLLGNESLLEIPFVDVAIATVEFSSLNIPNLDSFGFLVPSKEPEPILGVIFDSCPFPQTHQVFTVMMGGQWFDQIFGENPSIQDVEKLAVERLKSILSIKQDPVCVNGRILRRCIPQYTLNRDKRVAEIRRNLNGIYLVGSSYDGVGINDVILSAKNQVDQYCEK